MVAIEASPPPRMSRAGQVGKAMALGIGGTAVGLVFGIMLVAIIATRLFDFEVLTVRSGSMAPAIRSGDLIVVKPAAMAGVAEGDVVLFAAGGDGIPTVHRVAGINEIELRISDPSTGAVDVQTERRLVTKGDANPEPDPQEVIAGQLRGEVWFTVPGAGGLTAMPLQHILMGTALASLLAWGAWELRARARRTS